MYVQADKHGLTILYHIQQCTLAQLEIFRAKDGKGRIHIDIAYTKQECDDNKTYKHNFLDERLHILSFLDIGGMWLQGFLRVC